ncbi:MAG: type ISP restriction/modification enzyme [Parabacteroides merdae]
MKPVSLHSKLFPTPTTENLLICLSGVGNKSFSCLMTNAMPDYQIQFNSQCFPLYWWARKQKSPSFTF